ncbi:3'-5' exoribonuclease [Collimonas fungivorans]|uniref:3'-5' exoribonuclease n=1 Tax=Collimonas fungivorans TaxID=158899 RepID=UPI00077840E5|nr:3'-5' exoribonuclease [Collimonas fungivorans]
MTIKVFVDTEFTDFIDTHLISIGMAADSGEEFYAEVPYPDLPCSGFVREAVIPLLGRLPGAACSVDDLYEKMIVWLKDVRKGTEDVQICFDYQTDWDLFADVLDYRIPPWCHSRRVGNHINELLRCEFYKKNNLPEHHALYDALANRHAFQEVPSSLMP